MSQENFLSLQSLIWKQISTSANKMISDWEMPVCAQVCKWKFLNLQSKKKKFARQSNLEPSKLTKSCQIQKPNFLKLEKNNKFAILV